MRDDGHNGVDPVKQAKAKIRAAKLLAKYNEAVKKRAAQAERKRREALQKDLMRCCLEAGKKNLAARKKRQTGPRGPKPNKK